MGPFSVDKNAYNRFVNLDNIEFRIIDFLARVVVAVSESPQPLNV